MDSINQEVEEMGECKIKALVPERIYAVVCTSRFPESCLRRLESTRTKPWKFRDAVTLAGNFRAVLLAKSYP